MRTRLANMALFAGLATVWAAGCRTMKQDTGSAGLRSADDSLASGDAPNKGASYFDLIFRKKINGVWQHQIPFPYTEFVKAIETAAGAPATQVLIPKGRSLQKDAAGDKFLEFPRIVLGMHAPNPSAKEGLLGLNTHARIFTGYVEPSNQMEVISYNAELGRFEFQLVEDYAAGKTPKVRYAPRALCTTCHKGEAPIFPVRFWSESNFVQDVAQKLFAVHAPAKEYFGIPLDQPGSNSGEGASPKLDSTARDASGLLTLNLAWTRLCGADHKDAPQCRADFLFLALVMRELDAGGIAVPQGELDRAKSIKEIWARSVTEDGVGGATLYSSTIADTVVPQAGEVLDPKDKVGVPVAEAILVKFFFENLMNDLASTIFTPADVDLIRKAIAKKRKADGFSENLPATGQPVTGISIVHFDETDRTILDNALSNLAKRSTTDANGPLADVAPTRERLVISLLDELGYTPLPEVVLPPPLDDGGGDSGLSGVQQLAQEPSLKPFFTYCGACHRSGSFDWMKGQSKAEILAGMKDYGVDTILDAVKGEIKMPPPSGAAQLYGAYKQDAAAQEAMAALLKSL